MTAFDRAFARILEAEGGTANVSGDRGGLTKYGISQRWNPGVDVASLTVDGARTIYRQRWDAMGFDDLPALVAIKLFDIAVNAGPDDAATAAQRALCYLGVPVKVDGNLGPVTRAAVRACRDQDALLAAICGAQFLHYADEVEKPGQRKFAGGWAKRAIWRPA